ncbi:MAG: putative molybdenum carrier protein [Dokdonella sp.]
MTTEFELLKIVSGGQTGADRAALDWAIARGLAHGGWCPNGRKAEDGVMDPRYQLIETQSANYRSRTIANVRDSDATLIPNLGPLEGGTLETLRIAERTGREFRLIQLDGFSDNEGGGDFSLLVAAIPR